MSGLSLLVLQFAGSLAAILALAWLARRLGLGADVRLGGEDEARELAEAAVCGFDAEVVALDRAGIGALLRDRQGRVMVLKRHGAQFAARLLDDRERVRLHPPFLTVATTDARFGAVTLDLGSDAQVWAGSLRRLG